MAEGEKSYVFYSQMVLIATLTLTEVREREETGLGCVGVAEGVTVWRGKVCWSVIGTTHIHTLFPLICCTFTPTEAGLF